MTDADASLVSPPYRERLYRRNFPFFLADSILFTLAMAIISATTVIPDFLCRLTDSEILIGLSGSLFTIGFTLPQLFIARYIVRAARKKWWFVGPNILVRPVMLVCAILIVWIGADDAALILLVFFTCYGIAAFGDDLVGVPWADLAGTSLDNRWRARVFGLTSAATGVIMLGLAPLIGAVLGTSGPGFPANYAVLFGAAGVLFIVSIVPGLFFHELPGGRAREQLPALGEFLPELLQVLRMDGAFRAFIIARMFTSLFMMAAPFYIGYATVQLGLSSDVAVPVLLAMQTTGSIVGALAYTWLGARSNLLYIRLALGGSALLPLCALLAGMVGPLPLYLGFLVSGLATTDLAFGFLNWVVGYADADHRPLYVGLSNTVAAVISLIAPFIAGTIVESVGYRPLFVTALVMALSALFVALRFLRDPEPRAPAQ
ncbi:MAG TPA: MFS transporter [Herpetosiphonaceae bacterium]|nr:MFS transporter [Herpetosiphonaceae bacterium]